LLRKKATRVASLLQLCCVFSTPDMKDYKEEPDHMRTMIESMTKSPTSYTLPMKGQSTFNIFGPLSQGEWILDSGATDHMTLFANFFNLYVKMTRE